MPRILLEKNCYHPMLVILCQSLLIFVCLLFDQLICLISCLLGANLSIQVLDWYGDLNDLGKWDEKTYTPRRKKLVSTLENISEYNPDVLLKRLPPDALNEDHAILLGEMNQRELALSIYIHKVLCKLPCRALFSS